VSRHLVSPRPSFDPAALAPLPAEAAALVRALGAPPRLVAHLTLVHDVAARLVLAVAARWPHLALDADAVRFGAAIHDVGKALHPDELVAPGDLHEDAGRRALEAAGVAPTRARFAVTHAQWSAASPLEDLLVALADKVWRGKRVDDLEDLVVTSLAAATGVTRWAAFSALDAILTTLTLDGDARLAWQAQHAP
jgi:hypothetical protein